jgi:hypothetical protein
MDERSYLLVIPRIDGPEVVGATVHWPSDDRPYVRINEIGSVATVTRRRVPTEMLRPLEMDRNLDTAFAFAALGSHGAQLWYNGTGRDSVCLVRSLDTASDDPVLLTFVAAWGDDEFQDEWSDEWKTEVLGRSSASEFRDWAASTFETTIKND